MSNTTTTRNLFDAPTRGHVSEFIEEALSGPERGGITREIVIGGEVIDFAASRGWGVQIARKSANGEVLVKHLTGEALTLDAAEAAVQSLLAVA